jgi:hypothetical protein
MQPYDDIYLFVMTFCVWLFTVFLYRLTRKPRKQPNPEPSRPMEVSAEAFKAFLNDQKVQFVLFYAEDATYSRVFCQEYTKAIKQVDLVVEKTPLAIFKTFYAFKMNEKESGKLYVMQNQTLRGQHRIESVPTLVAFAQGKKTALFSGQPEADTITQFVINTLVNLDKKN